MVGIVGTTASDQECSCKEHGVYGTVLWVDSVVKLHKNLLNFNGEEETMIAVQWHSWMSCALHNLESSDL